MTEGGRRPALLLSRPAARGGFDSGSEQCPGRDGSENSGGHEDLTTTQISLQTLSGSERQAVDLLEAAIENSHTHSHTEPITSPRAVGCSYVN